MQTSVQDVLSDLRAQIDSLIPSPLGSPTDSLSRSRVRFLASVAALKAFKPCAGNDYPSEYAARVLGTVKAELVSEYVLENPYWRSTAALWEIGLHSWVNRRFQSRCAMDYASGKCMRRICLCLYDLRTGASTLGQMFVLLPRSFECMTVV